MSKTTTDVEERDGSTAQRETADESMQVAKGMFLEALRNAQEQAEEFTPFADQMDRLEQIDQLVGLLFGVAWEVYDQVDFEGLSPEEAATLMSEAIAEFKQEVVAKSAAPQGEEVSAVEEAPEGKMAPEVEAAPEDEGVSEGEEAPEAEATLEGEVVPESEGAPVSANAGSAGMSKGKSLSEIARLFAEDREADLLDQRQPVPQQAQPAQGGHPAVAVATTFSEAVRRVVSDPELSDDQKRQAVTLALAATMERLEDALPKDQADGLEDAPAWARAMVERMNTLETALQKTVNVGAGSTTSPENADSPTVPARKSVPPDLHPSTVVQRTQSLRDVAMTLLFGSTDPLMLP